MTEWGSSQVLKDGSTYTNQATLYTTLTKEKPKNHTIISIDTEKAFDKIQHPLTIKNSYQSGYRGNISQHNKCHLSQTHIQYNTNIILNGAKLNAFPLKSGKRQEYPLSPLLFNIVLEVLATALRQTKEIKGIQIGREEVRMSFYPDDMIIYIENPKDSTQNLYFS